MKLTKQEMKFTKQQEGALKDLQTSLTKATDSELLDQLAIIVHPDIINKFCDAAFLRVDPKNL